MFFYLICNASIGNYQESKKKYLTTFIYGTIIYILLHAFLHTSSSQIAIYLKSYFWVVVGLDCAAMYYLYTYLNENDLGTDSTKNLKSLLTSFYGQFSGEETKEKTENLNTTKKTNSEEKVSHVKISQNTEIDEKQELESSKLESSEPMAYDGDDALQSTSLLDLESFGDDQVSDSGSDVDLDNFEMTLQ